MDNGYISGYPFLTQSITSIPNNKIVIPVAQLVSEIQDVGWIIHLHPEVPQNLEISQASQ